MTEHPQVWDALAHPARRRLVDLLREEPAPTGALHRVLEAEHLSPSRFATQRHLQQLREAGVVLVSPRGRERMNALNGSALYEATIGWLTPPARDQSASLHRLRQSVETPKETPMSLRSFRLSQSIDIAAPRAEVWRSFREDTSRWWGAPYLLIEAAGSTLELPEELGGTVLESNGDHHASWGIVTELRPGHVYAWSGAMGMAAPSWGTVTYTFEDQDETATRVTVEHGHMADVSEETVTGYDRGWVDLNQRLRALVEDGAAHGLAGENRPVVG